MVLHTNYWKSNLEKIKDESYNYMILDTRHLTSAKDREIHKLILNLLTICRSLGMINETYKDIGSSHKIDFSILYEVIAAINGGYALSPEKEKSVYSFEEELDRINDAFYRISPLLSEKLFLPAEMHMWMIGFGVDKQNRLRSLNDDLWGNVLDEVIDMVGERVVHKISSEELKEEALRILENSLKEEEAKSKRELEDLINRTKKSDAA